MGRAVPGIIPIIAQNAALVKAGYPYIFFILCGIPHNYSAQTFYNQ